MRPDTFTITTFWLDWSLMPIMIIGAYFTARWALDDSKKASILESNLPSWAFSIPLFTAAVAWVIAGFGALIKEDYWEMRVIFIAFLLWTLCCFAGAILMLLSILTKEKKRVNKIDTINLVGLGLMSLLMVLPGLIDHSSPEKVTLVGHAWFILWALGVGLLTAGMLMGYPYKFPRFPLGLGIFFLVGWGLSEIAFKQASFPWLVRIWKINLGLEYIDTFPISTGWQIAGAVKFLLGLGVVVVIFIISRMKRGKTDHYEGRSV